jgi:hypothetical protein
VRRAGPGSHDTASFSVTDFSNPVRVGNYTDPSGPGAYLGTTLAVRGAALFVGYTAVAEDTKCCSAYCQDAKGTVEIACNCGHAGCRVGQGASAM